MRARRRADLLGELHAARALRPVRAGRRDLRRADLRQRRALGRDDAAHRPRRRLLGAVQRLRLPGARHPGRRPRQGAALSRPGRVGQPGRFGRRRPGRQDRRRAAARGPGYPVRADRPRARRGGAAQPRRRRPLRAAGPVPAARQRQAGAAGGLLEGSVVSDESSPAYHAGMRELQDRFDTRRLADRLEEKLARRDFRDEDRAFIESRSLFFLSTADADGQPDCSYQGGAPGFVRVTGDGELAFPHYDGNGMFRSLGNILVNPAVALLFIDFERPTRLRVNGSASVAGEDPLLASFAGAQLIVRVCATRIFPNCPRYIHRMTTVEPSPYVPRDGYTPPVPKWKRFDDFADVLPRDDPARRDR